MSYEKSGESLRLLFTYTDSLCTYVETKDLYKSVHSMKHHYDLSNFPKDHKYSLYDKRTQGLFNFEYKGIEIVLFIIKLFLFIILFSFITITYFIYYCYLFYLLFSLLFICIISMFHNVLMGRTEALNKAQNDITK